MSAVASKNSPLITALLHAFVRPVLGYVSQSAGGMTYGIIIAIAAMIMAIIEHVLAHRAVRLAASAFLLANRDSCKPRAASSGIEESIRSGQ